MSTGFPPRNTKLADDNNTMAEHWYRYQQELYQHSGLAGPAFPLYAEVPASGMNPDDALPPIFAAFQGNVFAWSCADGGSSRVHCRLSVPRGYTQSTVLIPFIRWSPSTGGVGDVVWELEYTAASVGEAFPATTIIAIPSTAAGVAYTHQDAHGAEIPGVSPGAMILCSVRRDGMHGNDTYTDAAWLLGAGVVSQHSAHGTQTVTV